MRSTYSSVPAEIPGNEPILSKLIAPITVAHRQGMNTELLLHNLRDASSMTASAPSAPAILPMISNTQRSARWGSAILSDLPSMTVTLRPSRARLTARRA